MDTAQPLSAVSSFVQRAKWLALFTIFYNVLEGAVSIAFGIQEDSFALAGFGLDSWIEVGSATLVMWRLRTDFDHSSSMSREAERRATLGIGALFVFLAAVTAAAAAAQLWEGRHPDSTVPGIVISLASLSFMFFLWSAKRKVARALDSKTLLADAACSLACIKLSFVLLAGSAVFHFLPSLWWADAAAALLLSFFVLQEGRETIRAARKPDFAGGCGCHG